MKKYVKTLAAFVFAAALAITSFTGCQNFLSGGNLKEELQDMLDYQYADYISISLDLNNSEGTAKGSTDLKKKPTDIFSISFVPNREYAFLDWQISYEKKENVQRTAMASEFISGNEDLNEIFETITVTEDDNGLLSISAKIRKTAIINKISVKPLLSKRPEVKTSSPAYDPNSTSRQTAITVQFTQQIQEDSFRFTAEELEALGVIVQDETPDEEGKLTYRDSENYVTYKDEDGRYYAYKSTADNFTYLKNIEITTDQGIKSVAESFAPPVLESFEDHSILMITPYSLPEKLIEIGNAGYKTIIVKLAKQIKNTDGIEFADDYSWGYQVNEETPQKARIKFECNNAEGTLDLSLPADTTKYNLSQRIQLGFTEDPDYQFLRWDFDEKYVTVPDFTKANATVLVIKETPEGETTSIKAVCAPRLKLDEENINTGNKVKDGSGAVYRNSSLQLAFTNELPQDEAGKKQLDNINITVGGNSVIQCFTAPAFIDEKTVQFSSDRSNRLEVPDGQTKTVTVTVPADMYYEYEYKEEIYRVTLGREASFSYVVSYETDDNAEVTFGVSSTAAGTVTPSGQKSYAIGKKISIKFEANDGWIFNGWKITSADGEMDKKIKVSSPSSAETELEVLDEIKGVIITADCTEMLNIERWSLTDKASDSDGSAEKPAVKDTGIEIKFNKPLDAANKLNEIKIFADGNDCSSMYSKSLSEDKKTVTVTNTKRLSVEKGTTKTVTVSVPKSFYCTENGKKITMYKDASYSYAVNYRTTEKAKITFSIINGETGEAFETDAVPGTLEPLSYNEYYLDETIGISFAENAGYQFYRWDCDSSAITLTGKSSQSELKVNGAAVTSVKAVVYARPSVTGIKVNGTELGETVSADPFDKDSEIVINLAHEIEADAAKKITVTYTGDNFSQKDYFNTVYDRNSKTVTLKPVKILSLRSGYDNETVTVTVPADIYYIQKYKDTERTTILASGGEGISRSYKIRNATKNKTQVTYNYGSGSLSANGNTLSSGSNSSYSIDDSISLGFTASADSVFTGWKVSCAAGTSYTVSKTGYETSGTVTVKDSSGNLFFTLQIDSQNPSKATAKVNGYVSTGISVSAGERLVAKVNDSGFTPKYVSAGVNCDTPVMIPFNKKMNASTVTLYNNSTKKGSIQIVNRESTGTHYEQYYEIKKTTGWNGNTLTISPKDNVYEILAGSKTVDIKVILNASAIKDEDGKALEGVTEYSYRLNPETEDFTKIQFNLNGCTIKIDGAAINDGFFKEYSIGTKLEVECIPDEDYKFSSWSLGGTSSEHVDIADDDLTKTTLTVKKSMGATIVEVEPQKILLPKIQISSVEPSYTAAGVYSDSEIVIPFNKEIDKTTVSLTSGSIQIVNKDNENIHYEQYYEIAENSWSGNTLTITPKVNVYEIFGTASIADIKVILGSGIKDKETDKNSLTGTTSFTYRINSTTSTKTKIQFIVGSTNCSVSLNGSEYSSNQTFEYNVGEKIEVQFIPNDGYKYSNCSMANNTSEAVSKTELGSGKYELKVTKSTTDVITLTPSVILLPKVLEASITPVNNDLGISSQSSIIIPFNQQINPETVILYNETILEGNIQVVNANTQIHYENYFIKSFTDENTKLVLTPIFNIKNNLVPNENDLIGIKVIIDGTTIKSISNERIVQDEVIHFYKINGSMEQIIPDAEVKLYKLQNNAYTELSSRTFVNFTDAEFPQNHIKNTVYFDFNCRDKDSGIKKLVIKETLIRDTAGTPITVTGENTTIFEISEPNYNDYYSNNEQPKTAYTLKSNDDGVVQLDFCFYDFAENEKKISFFVIKDTKLLSSDINPSQSDTDISFPGNIPLGSGKIIKKISDDYNADKIEKRKTKDGKITYNFTIPFTKEYYSTYTLKKNIVFSWGYSENEITNIVEDGQSSDDLKGTIGSYKIECDSSKDCFIKIKATDDVGNETELIRVIPRKIGIIKADDNPTENGAKQILFTTQGTQELVNLVNRYKAVQYGCCYLYSYQENEGSDIEYYSLCYMTDTSLGNRNYATSTNYFLYLTAGNIDYTEEESRPDGIYKFYVIPYYIYEENNYYGPLSDPFVYYVGISPSIEDPEEPIFPDSFEMVAAEPEINVGYRSVTVRTSGFNKTDDCIYGVRYNKKNSTTYYYSYDESFLVESGYEYDFNLFAVNNKNEIITSSLTYELDLTYDNVAPYMDELYLTGINFEKYTCFPEGIIWTGAYLPQDKGSGIYKNDDGNRQIEYYIIRERSKSQYTETDLSQYTKKFLTYPADMDQLSTVVIPFDDLKESIYTLVLNVKDDNKDTEENSLSNSRIFSFSMNTEILPTVKFEYVWKKNDNGSWKSWPEVVEKTSQSGRGYNCLFLQLKNNKWMYGFQQIGQVSNYDRSQYNADVHYCKICSNKGGTDTTLEDFCSYLNLYVCHDYIVRKKNGADTDLNSKAVIIGVDSDYLIYYDAPCFVHTMAYPTQSINNLEKIAAEGNLSSTAAVWESMGREYGLKEFVTPWGTKDYSTYTTPVDEIESGFSYVTITHFADGTVRMSDVKNKP